MKTRFLKDNILSDISSFISSLPIAVFVVNKEGEGVMCNQTFGKATGFDVEEFKSLHLKKFFGREFSEQFTPMIQDIFSGKIPEDIILGITHKKEQRKVFFKISGNLFQRVYAVFSAVDVTENIQVQQTLLNKKNQLFSIIHSLGDIILKVDRAGNYNNNWSTDVPTFFPEINVMDGKSLRDSFPAEVADSFLNSIERAIKKDQMVELEFSLTVEQAEKWCLAKIAPIHEKDAGKVEEVLVIIRDITEEKENQQQIEYKNKIINQLTSVSNGPILHYFKNESMEYKFISGNITSLTGYTLNELEDINWLDVIYENDRENVRRNILQVLFQNQETHLNLFYRIVTKEGEIKWITDHITRSQNEGQEVFFGVMVNMTEVHLLNTKLKQRDRILTKSGKVAKIGGWEHDLKTDQTILTDEIYEIFEEDSTSFHLGLSLEYYLEEYRPLVKRHVEELKSYGTGFDLDLPLVTGKGKHKWVKAIGCAEWHHGQFSKIYGVIQDITEKKEKDLILHESERRFNAAFEQAPLGIGLVTPEGQWIKTNRALSRFLEYPEEELKKISLGKINFMEDLNHAIKLSENKHRKKHGIYQLEKEYLTRSGKVKWGNLGINIVKNDKNDPLYAIVQIVDITKNKKFEKDLILAKKEADEANKAKTNFLSAMSHEIRTPLNGVIGVTNLLLEEINESQHREKLGALKFSSNSLLLIVNDILDYSKIKSGALSLEENPFVLKRLVEAVRGSHIQKAKELGNTINVHYDANIPEKLIGDELRIGQILNNLVHNSVKFTKEGTIDIFVKIIGQSNEWNTLFFSVKDNGIGIPKDTQDVLFDQFTQGESGITRKYGGTGLGLYIVKGLLKAMNSEAILESELGRGTEISFQLTLRSAKGDQEASDVNLVIKNKNLEHKTILLVEDNPVNTMVVSDYIKKWKGEVIKAENGKDAIEIFEKNMDKIDLILMDLQMPIMNGFDATEQIKKIKPDIPVIAMTASIGDKSKLEAFDYGMAAYIIKPFLPHEFYNTIKTHLQ